VCKPDDLANRFDKHIIEHLLPLELELVSQVVLKVVEAGF
jgi:hypothetical protein